MSEETVLKFKLATLVTIAMGILSIAVTVMAIWVGSISSDNSTNKTDIATLKECTKNQSSTLTRIESGVSDLNKAMNEHIRRNR